MTQSNIITESVFAPSAFEANMSADLTLRSGSSIVGSANGVQDILLIIILIVVALGLFSLVAYTIHESQNPTAEKAEG